MATAYKCDRCGRLYSGPDSSVRIIGGGNYISSIRYGNNNWSSNSKDLCPDCARDFAVWWEHSNISACYMLDKMTAEMARKMIENDRQMKKE